MPELRYQQLPTNDWRNWTIKGCLRDDRGVLRLIIQEWGGSQHTVMAIEAPDWKPLVAIPGPQNAHSEQAPEEG